MWLCGVCKDLPTKILASLSASLMFIGLLNHFPLLTMYWHHVWKPFLEIFNLFNFGHMHTEKVLTNHFLCLQKPKYWRKLLTFVCFFNIKTAMKREWEEIKTNIAKRLVSLALKATRNSCFCFLSSFLFIFPFFQWF